MLPLLIGGMAAQVGGGLLGYFLSKGDQKTADRLEREALAKYGEVTEETIAKVAPQLIPPTELAKIQADPAYKEAQLGSFDALQAIIDGGGMTASDDAALNKVNNRLAEQENVARSRIQSEMDSRNIGGSGTELALLRASGQDKLQRQSEASMDQFGRAQDRAFDAIMSKGQMAGQMRGQDFGEKAQVASAQDAINRFNTGVNNTHQYWMADQRMNNAGVQLGGVQRQADQKRRNAQDTRQTIAGVGQGIGQAATYGAVYGQKAPGTDPNPVKASTEYGPYAQTYQAPAAQVEEDYNPYDDERLWNGGN